MTNKDTSVIVTKATDFDNKSKNKEQDNNKEEMKEVQENVLETENSRKTSGQINKNSEKITMTNDTAHPITYNY
eukprot:CAMPEP_0118696344 /NCGR_PEP_ID=MMETSP0800-20121206/13786_1 /TAXON_ID=210618 ORGANISM="Striatella unipunctata, Strain CCMP2910" /NCGR_SAMPLE_ID=MMETSP0800 /ASSEMBLY_ACC=CAM_ASM_000638 /LENGTH=73 /DNA_ID=CAMNT_0006595429 /DNA_START=835 /DNA_END=1056 /DNA_ORIENTATION=+